MFKWVELGEGEPDRRFLILERVMNENGLENKFDWSLLSPEQDLRDRIQELSGQHTQIRVSGAWRDRVKDAIDTWPATLLTLKSADALVCDNQIWWARNFLSDSIQILIAEQLNGLDLSSAALLIGATPETRAAIHALVRVGICRFLISDRNESLAQELVHQLEKLYFNVKFEFVKCEMITQLPASTSVAINTLSHQDYSKELAELSYLNFLIPGGTWLDLSLGPKSESLDEEAKIVGAQVISGWTAWARSDLLWINYIEVGTSQSRNSISLSQLSDAYGAAYGSVQSS